MEKMNERTILKRRASLETLRRCKAVAKEVEAILNETDIAQGGKEKVYQLTLDRLDNLEYLVLLDQNCRSITHTNRLREGWIFDDEVGKKAVDTKEPILQLYYRDTGEIIVDAACPILVNGQHRYTLRGGSVVQSKRLWLFHGLIQTIPWVWVFVVMLLGSARGASVLWGLVGGVFITTITAYFTQRWETKHYEKLKKAMQRIALGDLAHQQETNRRDEMGQLFFEINKLSLGLKGLLKDFASITQEVSSAATEQKLATNEVSKGTESIAATIEEVTAGTQEQASAVQQMVEFISGVIAGIEEIQSSMALTLKSSQEGKDKMLEGNKVIEESVVQMMKIDTTFTETAAVIEELAEKSEQIGEIINTITGIAEQTNLLALNAAIEAARAGENGRGFAVVAEEVRKLAENSSQAAREIMDIISETQEKTREAVRMVKEGNIEVERGTEVIAQTGSTMQEVMALLGNTVEQMNQNTYMALELMEAGRVLSGDTQRVSEISQGTSLAMQDISATVQQQTVMAEQIAHSAEDLEQTAQRLFEVITRFKLD